MEKELDTSAAELSDADYHEILRQDILMDTEEFNITPQKVRRILAANLEE